MTCNACVLEHVSVSFMQLFVGLKLTTRTLNCCYDLGDEGQWHGRIQRGGGGRGSGPPHPEKSQNVGVSSNTGPDPLNNRKATKPAFNIGPPSARQRNAI